VSVGRRLMRLPTPDNVLSLMVFWELPLDLEEELAAPIKSIVFGEILASGNNIYRERERAEIHSAGCFYAIGPSARTIIVQEKSQR
jgi:hypothetical protein